MRKYELSIVIPAYLEEENLRILLPRLKSALSSFPFTYEINVVDVMKPIDLTGDVCRAQGVSYFNREASNSYGDAVRTGIKYAKGKYTIFMDGDGSHSPEFVPFLLQYKDNYEVVIASRYVQGGVTDNGFLSKMMSKVVNIVYALVLNLHCKDVSNSFKLYRTDMLKKLNLYSHNFDIIEEILFKLKKQNRNLAIKEIPYAFKKRIFGCTKRNLLLFAISYFFSLIRLRFKE